MHHKETLAGLQAFRLSSACKQQALGTSPVTWGLTESQVTEPLWGPRTNSIPTGREVTLRAHLACHIIALFIKG